jgi:glycopeptide antibiotics resistance protein
VEFVNKRNTIKRSFAAIFYVVSALLIFISIYLELDPRFQVSVQDKLVQSAIIILSLSIATLFTVRLYVEQKKRIIIIKFSVFILFIYYLFILIYMLFLDKYSGRNNAILPYQNYDLYFKNHTNFIPFATIVDYFNGWRYHTINRSSILTNLIGNIIAFMPMGIFLPLLF